MPKQPSSRMCFVCGKDNSFGLRIQFYSEPDGSVQASYVPTDQYQGYPGVLHGGIVTALLDELIGRTAIANDLWCMTAKIQVRFHNPVPIGVPIFMRGKVSRQTRRLLEGHAEMRSEDGTLLAEAVGTYMRIPDAQLTAFKTALGDWRVE